jgi:transposase
MEITTVGLDLAKKVFHVVCCNRAGKLIKKKKLTRTKLLAYFAQLPPCLVGMEACASAHYWGREIEKLGHTVKLLPPKKVKAYIQGQKNDYNDAAGIAEAATRESIRPVSIKTIEQQDLQSLQRMRSARTKERTSLCNQIRGLLGEYGIIIPKGISQVRSQVPEILEDAENNLSSQMRYWIHRSYRQLLSADEEVAFYTRELEKISRENVDCQRLKSLPGFGPIVASAYVSHVGDGQAFKRGREVSASIGIVPRQHSSGDKAVLLSISKRGNSTLRSLMIHGARSVVRHAEGKDDPLSQWINRIKATRGKNKAAVALANKLARIAWAMIVNKTDYQPGMLAQAV